MASSNSQFRSPRRTRLQNSEVVSRILHCMTATQLLCSGPLWRDALVAHALCRHRATSTGQQAGDLLRNAVVCPNDRRLALLPVASRCLKFTDAKGTEAMGNKQDVANLKLRLCHLLIALQEIGKMLAHPGSYPVRVSYYPHPAFKFVGSPVAVGCSQAVVCPLTFERGRGASRTCSRDRS